MQQPIFKLSLISLALFGGVAHAADGAEQPAQELQKVEVRATSTRAPSNWKSEARSNTAKFKDRVADQIGLTVGGGSVSAHWLTIRGIGQNRTDVVVDNTNTSSLLWHHQSRYQFDPAMVKVVGVDKGTGSASAGIGATSGAIHATTVDAKDLLLDGKSFGARIGTNYNSNKGANLNLAAYTNVGGFDALLMGSWANDRNYKDGDGKVMTNTARKQGNYLAKIGYALNPDHHIGLSYRREHFYGDATMRPEFQYMTKVPTEAQPMEQTQQTINLEYKGKNLGFARDVEANVFQIKAEDQRHQFDLRNNVFIPNSPITTSELKTTGANVGFTSEIGQTHLLKYGINYRSEEVENKTAPRANRTEDKKDYGVYVEGIWDFAPFTLTTGLRYDYFKAHSASTGSGQTSASKGTINPSIAVMYDITPNLTVHAKWNQASRSPQLVEAFQAGNGNRGFAAGLKPEIARLTELGLSWNQGSFSANGKIFHQRIKNFMQSGQVVMVTNLGTLKSMGYELNAAYQYGGLTARVGTSRANISTDGFALPTAARDITIQGQQWLTSLSYRFNNPALELGWRGRYLTGKKYTINKTAYNRAGYGVHDIYANWQPLRNDTLNVNFAINNIGNKKYQSHSQTISAKAFNEPGREYRIGVNYRF